MRPLNKFLIRLVASIIGAGILLHFFPFLGKRYAMWAILAIFILFMAYGLETLHNIRFRK